MAFGRMAAGALVLFAIIGSEQPMFCESARVLSFSEIRKRWLKPSIFRSTGLTPRLQSGGKSARFRCVTGQFVNYPCEACRKKLTNGNWGPRRPPTSAGFFTLQGTAGNGRSGKRRPAVSLAFRSSGLMAGTPSQSI